VSAAVYARSTWEGHSSQLKQPRRFTSNNFNNMAAPPLPSVSPLAPSCDLCGATTALPPICASGHRLCGADAADYFVLLSSELALQGGVQGANYFSRLGLHEGTLPGLLCPQCLPSESARASYSARFWAAVAASEEGAPPPAVSPGDAAAAPPDASYLPGWWAPASLQALAAWVAGPAGAAEGVAPLRPAHVDLACSGATHLAVNLPQWLAGGVDPASPRAHALLACPAPTCGALLSITARPRGATHVGAPFHVTCAACGGGACGECALPWSLPHNPLSHAARTCSEHMALAVGGGGRGGAHPAIGDVADEDTGAKRCPNPACGALVQHSRGHMCHAVTCVKCRTGFCFCCLATTEELHGGGGAHACPGFCDDTCDCAPCVDCERGADWKKAHCDFCGGGARAWAAPSATAQRPPRSAGRAWRGRRRRLRRAGGRIPPGRGPAGSGGTR
jgi:hypothetical protein